MDPPPKNFLSPKSHILDSNGVWYSSFWSEGPKNHRNLKILVSKFVPRGFEARRTWGFEAQRHGVLRRGAKWDGTSRGGAGVSRGSAKWDGTSRCGAGVSRHSNMGQGYRGDIFYISVQQILNLSQSGEELCGAFQAVQTDSHLFH